MNPDEPIRIYFRSLVASLTWLLAVAQTQVIAAESPAEKQPPLWEFQIVAFGQNFPAYPSSADQNTTILPLPFPVYRGKFLRFGEDLEEIAADSHFCLVLCLTFP